MTEQEKTVKGRVCVFGTMKTEVSPGATVSTVTSFE